MADVRCPNCGKDNPVEAEKCFFCGELLSTENPIVPEGQAEDAPDWLSGLRSGDWQSQGEQAEESDEPAAEGDIPDWLSRVRARTQEETGTEASSEQPSEEQATPGEDLDWLKSLGGDPGQTQGSADDWLAQSEDNPVAPLGVSGEDWLNSLRGDEPPAEEQPSVPSAEPEPEPESKSEEWLGGLEGWIAPPEPETPTTSAEELPADQPEGAVPGWFSQLPDAGQTPEPVEPNWSSLNAISDAKEEAPQDADEESGLPDWLTNFASEPVAIKAAGETPEAELPDWLGSVPSTPEAPAEPSAAAESVPDWLANAPAPEEEDATGIETPAAEGLGWLGEISAPDANLPAGESSAPEGFDLSELFGSEAAASEPTSPPAEEIPDFSSLLADKQPGEAQDAESQPPDFSSMFGGETTEPVETGLEKETPDFASLLAAGALAASASAADDEEKPAETPEWMSDLGQAESEPEAAETEAEAEVPNWLKDFGEAGEPEPAVEAPLEGAAPFVDEELPAWLDNVKAASPEEGEPGISPLIDQPEPAPELSAPFQVDLPEWLELEEEPEAARSLADELAEEPSEELAKADLPSWVENLRPLELVIPGELRRDAGETVIEKAGPLAGMRGVLQSEDLADQYRKPPVYSARLRVTDRQRAQAAILENLIGVEAAPKQVSSEISRAPQMILRVVIALLLILSLLTMLLPDFRLVDPPAVIPPGMAALYDRVENLPADSAVLLAFDYEPGLSGEMRYAANAVIEHLMVKNSRLAIVSTVPTGPVLADDLLAEVNVRRPEYQTSERTVNLGYLPGGTTSLLEFAQNPKGATPSSLDTPISGVPAWDHPAVVGLGSLQDFALVIVLTDSPETGRAWIEQVQPVLGSVPLSMVASAQAGPLLQPYYDSGQIQGMTVGLQGGALYEQRSGRVSLANRFWGAYQSGSLAGLLLLLIGGIISAVLGLSDRKPTQKGKA